MRGLFVTGTDTGAGKTVLSAALLAAMIAAGEPIAPYKPVLTGLDEPPDPGWPRDHELLGAIAAVPAQDVAPLRFGPAVSPHLAAELAGVAIDPGALLSGAQQIAERAGGVLVEGVGGLLVPLAGDYLVRDLARALELPVVLAARPGLGTINHTLLTLEVARAAELAILAVVLTPWPAQPSPMLSSNRATIERLGDVPVHTLPPLSSTAPVALTAAAAALPWRRWLSGQPGSPAPR
jgi:dethiobiotin synthetase